MIDAMARQNGWRWILITVLAIVVAAGACIVCVSSQGATDRRQLIAEIARMEAEYARAVTEERRMHEAFEEALQRESNRKATENSALVRKQRLFDHAGWRNDTVRPSSQSRESVPLNVPSPTSRHEPLVPPEQPSRSR